MKKSTNIRTGRHCVFELHVHLVFVTKYRKRIFTKPIQKDLGKIFSNVCENFEARLIEFDGEHDHVHLLVNYNPKTAISKLVNSLKGVSSRLIRKKYSSYIQPFLWKNTLWSPSYFAGTCGGASIETIRKYVQQQQTPF